MKEEILSLIRHRLEQAEDSIKEAKLLQKEGMSFRSVMNRLYYAMFYSVLALLQQKGIGTYDQELSSRCKKIIYGLG